MDNYRLFEKIIKTKVCGYFRAEAKDSGERVVVKKLKKATTWEEMLKDRDLSLMKHSKVSNLGGIREIVKEEDQFYLIMDNMGKNLEYVIKGDIEKEEIIKIGRQLIQLVVNLARQKVYPREMRPVHLFLSPTQSSLRLAHLETLPKDLSNLDLVELQDLRYLSPEQVLTTKDIDERSLVFNAGLILCDLILGKSLITANTKMHYIYELVRLFPDQSLGNIEGSQHDLRPSNPTGDDFETTIRKFNFTHEFVALLRQMLKFDRTERPTAEELLDAWDVVIENERTYRHSEDKLNEEVDKKMPPQSQIDNGLEFDFDFEFEFEQKPTLSSLPMIKTTSAGLPSEKNVDDDVSQPIIIKQSSMSGIKARQKEGKLNTTKDSVNLNRSRMTTNFKQPSLSTIRKPQLTNYALNEANLGVQMGMNPSIFSENEG